MKNAERDAEPEKDRLVHAVDDPHEVEGENDRGGRDRTHACAEDV